MSDAIEPPVQDDLPNDSPPPSPATGPFDASGPGELKAGQRWRDFVIEAPLRGGGPHAYLADHLGLMEKVVVRARPIGGAAEWRRGAWDRLRIVPDSSIVRCIEAHEEAGWRYEVTAVPPAMTLREWAGLHRPGFGEIESLLRQLAAILGALHAQGVVHLNLRPESIHIDETAREPVFLLGGLEEATLYTQPGLTSVAVDPFYAPPEAMEPGSHGAGTRLCAWDWWSVGRIVQECLLGRHVLALVLDRDVSRVTPELRARAAALLRETEPAGVRAGALEYMPPDPATAGLMRGLLTGSCEGRWGLDAVQRWLRREAVQDHYDLPRTARLWVWRGRGFTLAEAAEFFTQAGQWADGENTLFYQQDPESFAFFLNETPAHRAAAARLQAVCDLTETRAWEEVPAVVRRTVTAAMAWLSLAVAGGAPGRFRVRGQTVDVGGLTELLKMSDGGEGVALVSALLAPALIEFLEPLDAPAARGLRALAAHGGAAVQVALQHGWLDPDDDAGRAKIFGLALLRAAALRDRVARLHTTYATSRDPELARLMTAHEPQPMELVLLVFTGEAAERCGFITHADWRKQRRADLTAQGQRIVTALLWLRVRRWLTVGRLWGLPWPGFAAITLGLTAVAGGLGRAAEPAAGVAAALLLSRAWLWFRLRGLVRRGDAAAAPWAWRDGLKRSDDEVARMLTTTALTPAEIGREQQRLRAALEEFVPAGAARRAVAGPRGWDLLPVLAAGGAMALAALGYAVTSPRVAPKASARRPGATANAATARVAAGPAAPRAADPAGEPDRLLATGRYEVLDDGFGRRLRGPLRSWNLTSPAAVASLEVRAGAPASPEQAAFALVSGNLLVQPYLRKSVNVLLAVRVPTSRGVGLLVFNARDRRLVDREVRLVRTPLRERTWYQLGPHRVIFLGVPPALAPEISLAPP